MLIIFTLNDKHRVLVRSASLRSKKVNKGTRRSGFSQGAVESVEHAKMLSSSSLTTSNTQSRANQSLNNVPQLQHSVMDRIFTSSSSNMSYYQMRKKYGKYDKYGKKKKGKKGKKKYREPTPAPTISSQPSISTMPSFQPSTSVMPSSQPSQYPSLKPSQHPSTYPTSSPSIHPTSKPSSQPSIEPTKKPSQYPSSNPTLTPSLQPTSKPSLQPSAIPTSQPSIHPTSSPSSTPTLTPSSKPSSHPSSSPTLHPSTQPSSTPTISSLPSSSPSISHQPSYKTISEDEAIYDDRNVQIGTKSACKTPKNIDEERYAERELTSVEVRFQYLVYIEVDDDDTENDDDVKDILKDVDNSLGDFVFDDYIQCQGNDADNDNDTRMRRRQYRKLQYSQRSNSATTRTTADTTTYDPDEPMGVSTLPEEKPNPTLQCAKNTASNEKCIVVDGGVSLFFERESKANTYLKKYDLLLHIRDAMDEKSIQIKDDNNNINSKVKGMDFVQATDLDFDRGESIVGRLDRSDGFIKSGDDSSISVTGGLFIASGILVFIGALAAIVKRRRRSRSSYARRNPAVLEALDKEYEGDLDDNESDDGDEHSECPFEEFSPQRSNKSRDLQFPVPLVETRSSALRNKGHKKYSSIQSDDDDLYDNHTTSSQRSKKRRKDDSEDSDYHSVPFPIKLSETRNGQTFPVSRRMNPEYIRTATQDVHHCTSANCIVCDRKNHKSKNGIRFIPSSEFYDDIEVVDSDDCDRISDRTLDFSRPTVMYSRNYDNKDTVHL